MTIITRVNLFPFVQSCEESGEITADITKLKQILINLLSNANKFTENGLIEFKVYKEVRDSRQGYEFFVRDTGIGMTPEQLEKLFHPFTQADASTTRKMQKYAQVNNSIKGDVEKKLSPCG
ncbi:ATP-binding protein [Paenibacillus agaridevorans]|uniref:ATP-binding protein n=1 Tax=Paenibacillus agaridevorans TaxID=171404 RepID=UPI003CCEF79C